jgi:hypothetical protein
MSKSGWGGRRAGAGRPATKKVVQRAKRPNVSGRVQVTLRLAVAVRSAQVKEAIEAASDHLGMRIADFSLKGDRIHLTAEVKNKKALSRGMQGFCIRLARAVNREGSHQGKVFADRYEVATG